MSSQELPESGQVPKRLAAGLSLFACWAFQLGVVVNAIEGDWAGFLLFILMAAGSLLVAVTCYKA